MQLLAGRAGDRRPSRARRRRDPVGPARGARLRLRRPRDRGGERAGRRRRAVPDDQRLGDTGRVFAVDGSGHTVGVTHWSEDPTDTEALAPAGPGTSGSATSATTSGAGRRSRSRAIPVGRGDRTVHPTTYRLAYPDGATDAETLLRDPATGRLYVASKNVFGGVLYAVPAHLDASGPNPLTPIGRVLPVATDGSFFPDGQHLIVRNYCRRWSTPGRRCSRSGRSRCRPSARARGSRSPTTAGSTSRPRGRARRCSGRAAARDPGRRTPAGLRGAWTPSASPGSSRAADPAAVEPASRDAWPWLAGGLLGLGRPARPAPRGASALTVSPRRTRSPQCARPGRTTRPSAGCASPSWRNSARPTTSPSSVCGTMGAWSSPSSRETSPSSTSTPS